MAKTVKEVVDVVVDVVLNKEDAEPEVVVVSTSAMVDVKKAGEKYVFAKAHRIEPQQIDISEEGQPTDNRTADYCVELPGHTPMTKGQFSRGWSSVSHSDAKILAG